MKFIRNKRRFKRRAVRIETEIIPHQETKGYSGSVVDDSVPGIRRIAWHRHLGTIENISQGGVLLKTSPSKTHIDYTPGSLIGLNIELFYGGALDLICTVKWSQKDSPEALSSSVGMEIINPPHQYSKLLKMI